MKVSQYMTRSPITIDPQTEFHRAFDLMRAHHIHHLPVVDGGRVIGLIAERDLLLAAANYGSAEVPVADIMRGLPICIAEGAELKQAARLLVIKHIGSLPVLNPAKALVGIITETDIFKITAGMLRARPTGAGGSKKAARGSASKSGARSRARAPARR